MPALSRRAFLGATGVAAGAVVFGVGVAADSAFASPAIPHRSLFMPLVGSTLSLRSSTATYRARLTHVHDLLPTHVKGSDSQFGLMFAVADPRIVEGIFRLDHPRLPAVELFLAPVGPPSRDVVLQAVVNRLA